LNNSADILGNNSAGSLAFGYVSGGFGLRRGGRHLRIYRDFVPSANGPTRRGCIH